jgi:hypothetical protein
MKTVPLKRRLIFNGLQSFIFQETEFFITTAVRTSFLAHWVLFLNARRLRGTGSNSPNYH